MKHKTIYSGYGFSLLALLVLRVCELAFAVETQTGFYKTQYEGFWLVSLVATAVCTVAITYFSFTDVGEKTESESKAIPVLEIFVAAGIAVRTISVMNNFAGITSLIFILTALLAVGTYLFYGCSAFTTASPKPSFYILAVPFWMLELIYVFLNNNDISSMPERAYSVITAALCLMATLYQLKCRLSMLTDFTRKIMVALLLVCSILCIAAALPKYLLVIFDKGYLLHTTSVGDLLYLVYGIYLAVYVFLTFKTKKTIGK